LVAPFFDPEVGATMGRVVPHNVGSNLLTRFLDFERSGGYQVDQQARMNLSMVPQYGGTVGGIRVSALESIGGWRDDVFAEDTDLTYRLLLKNWKTIYLNRAECYEEVPESWPIRIRQIVRWARGHNQALYHHFWKLVGMRGLSASEKFDGLALLGVYTLPLVLILGWLLMLTLLYFYATPLINLSLALFSLVAFSALGNFAAFFEIAVASYLDGSRERIRLLPFACFGFLVSVFSISRATLNQMIFDRFTKSELGWEKTVRYRQSNTFKQ
jgi:cellulose synthase/poly-beta-1,6-N-acetylglucosamine synthase-like glycosyltransferase